MNFKKKAIVISLLSGLTFASAQANAEGNTEGNTGGNAESSVQATPHPTAQITLQGFITNSTCIVTVNGGKATLNTGNYKTGEFKENTITKPVEMPVSLTNCGSNENGQLIVSGLTSVKNNDQNIFVSDDNQDTGFMIQEADTTTIIKNGSGPQVKTNAGSAEYIFKVGMASTNELPKPGAYTAPIVVAYISE